jgi:hypothetical protein
MAFGIVGLGMMIVINARETHTISPSARKLPYCMMVNWKNDANTMPMNERRNRSEYRVYMVSS